MLPRAADAMAAAPCRLRQRDTRRDTHCSRARGDAAASALSELIFRRRHICERRIRRRRALRLSFSRHITTPHYHALYFHHRY